MPCHQIHQKKREEGKGLIMIYAPALETDITMGGGDECHISSDASEEKKGGD